MKAFVLILNAGCIITSYWFILVAQQYVHFSRGKCLFFFAIYFMFCAQFHLTL